MTTAQKISLPSWIVEAKVNRQLLFDCLQACLANRRVGTRRAKTRGEVRGSTAKIYKQKGTGQARHGDIKANIFVGGGIAFPPLPQNWRIRFPKQAKRKALVQALSLKAEEGNLMVVDAVDCPEIKTKKMAGQLAKWKISDGLIVLEKPDEKVRRSVRNIPRIELTTADGLHLLSVLSHQKIVVTEKALAALEKRLICA